MTAFSLVTFGNSTKRGRQIATAFADLVPMVHDFVRYANHVSKLFQADIHASVFNNYRVPSVADLLSCRGPSAVLWRVWSIVVNSVNRGVYWAISHIGQEILKRMPTLAHGNPTTSVKRVGMIVRVFAPTSHSRPRCMLRSAAHSVAQVVAFNNIFAQQTPAGCCAPVSNIGPISVNRLTAIARQPPDRPALLPGANRPNGNKATKSFTSEVDETRVSRIIKLHTCNSTTNTRSKARYDKCMEVQ